ncbi:tryptophan 7-halogenase [Novosphingopyxis sp.]|uniref:tryptophan 7-halogenase n=1 Tax=Novosphingopyxis sp. TaxID=2709690 RepID=UPI003B5A6E11
MRRFVLIGRDAALWLTAAALARGIPSGLAEIAVVELPSVLTPAGVYASQPPLEALHQRIGIDEAMLLRLTGAVFSLGQNFTGPPARTFFHAWAAYGAPVERHQFFDLWLRARDGGLRIDLQEFCPAAIAATHGRIMLPSEPALAFGRIEYGYHLPAIPYCGLLKELAAKQGVAIHRSTVAGVEHAPTPETLAAVILDDGTRIEGELFVDATGDGTLLDSLAGRTSGRQNGAARSLRLLTANAPAFGEIPPFAELRATPEGWLRLHPVRTATGVQYVFDDRIGDDEAVEQAGQSAQAPLWDIEIGPVLSREIGDPWTGNCVAIGSSARTFDPVHPVQLHAIQLGIVHLLALLPATDDVSAERREYNRIIGSSFDRIADFLQAVYALAPWTGPFWDDARAAPASDALQHLLATFRARGEIAPMEDESFSPDSWRIMLTGLGAYPESWPPTADRLAPERLKHNIVAMLRFIKDTVLEQPHHNAYLRDMIGNPRS